jgi:hypothetical protein
MTRHPRTALQLTPWADSYTLGAFCAKASLTAYALATIPYLRAPHHSHADLFHAGQREAESTSWADLAYEIRHLRERQHHAFDAHLARVMRPHAYQRMMLALTAATNWETLRQIRIGQEISRVQDSTVPKRISRK